MRRFTHTFPQRISAFLLCLALLVGLLPVTALAAGKHDSHSNGWTELTANNINAGLSPGQYYLSGDVNYTGSNSIMITGTVTLCLNGHVLNLGGKNITIDDDGAALTLCDCNPVPTRGYLDSEGLWHAGSSTDGTGSPCNLTGGVITGGRGYEYDSKLYTYGGGVFVRNGTFTMEGGNIAGNTSEQGDGGGVYVNNENNFTMNGGTIKGNSAKYYGGGVNVSSSDFIMNDGSIADNTATHSGGGVCLWYEGCTFTMNGGSITGNHATHSGGLYMYDASFTMNGGSITGNHASDSGVGGDGSSLVTLVTISGSPVIKNNTKTDGAYCNVYLKESQHITIGGELTNAQIGVTMEPPGSFTSGWGTYMQGKNPAEYFTVEDNAYGIGLDADREAVLGQKCTVTLETNGGALPDGDSPFASVVGAALPTPTKTGYTFTGWYTASDCSDGPVKEIPTPSSGGANITLYAGWRANTYTVTFNANGGNGAMAPQSFTYGTPQKLTANGFSCLGKTFAGWNTKADGTGMSYTDGQQISNLTADLNGVVTLYAQWTANSYQVTLNTNGGTIADGKGVTSYTYGVGATLPTEITRSNYSFQGWYEDAGFTGEPVTEITGTDTGDKTYYAKWQYDPPYIPPTYAVTVPETTGGTVEVSPSRASSGRRVTITTQPAPGYELESLTVLDSRGSEIALTDQGDGKYTFTMPSRKVTVQASFAPVPLPFEDVPPGVWYEEAVRYAYTHNIMEGMSATTFVPGKSLTRAEAVQVLYNLEGQPTVSESTTFPDLVYEWYKPAISWAESTGVVDGYEDGTFHPDQPVTRQEFAQMMYNYGAYKDYDLSAQGDLSSFPDGDQVQKWALPAMSWANGNQLINGHDDGTLEPAGTTTRAQAASILMRFDQKLVEN